MYLQQSVERPDVERVRSRSLFFVLVSNASHPVVFYDMFGSHSPAPPLLVLTNCPGFCYGGVCNGPIRGDLDLRDRIFGAGEGTRHQGRLVDL